MKDNWQDLAIEWANEVRRDGAIVVDTESCGGRKEDEIIALGICSVVDGSRLFYSLLRPTENVKFNHYASQVHGICMEDLLDKPTLVDVWEEVEPILTENKVIAYSESADRRMLQQTADNQKIVLPIINWECAMYWYKKYTGQKNVNLTTACQQMRVKAGGHNAIEDAIATARVIYRMAQGYGRS